MKTKFTIFAALLAIAFFAAPAGAQQPARRNSSAATRQDNKVERQQTKVDNVQRPTNITNQNNTDRKVRESGTQSGTHRGSVTDGSRPSGGNGQKPSGNNNGGYGNNSQRPPVNGNGNNGGYGNNSQRPPVNGNGNNGGYGRPGDNGQRPPKSGNGKRYDNRPPAGFDPNRRPPVPSVYSYSREQLWARTNTNTIVVNTLFSSKAEAYDYIARLLDERYYTMASYGNNYNWIKSDVTYIPTPFDWTNPMTHNQFRMEFNISKVFGTVKVQITAYWRESLLSESYTRLRFQPSDRYSTYYAWRVLEDFAENIPHYSISYK